MNQVSCFSQPLYNYTDYWISSHSQLIYMLRLGIILISDLWSGHQAMSALRQSPSATESS